MSAIAEDIYRIERCNHVALREAFRAPLVLVSHCLSGVYPAFIPLHPLPSFQFGIWYQILVSLRHYTRFSSLHWDAFVLPFLFSSLVLLYYHLETVIQPLAGYIPAMGLLFPADYTPVCTYRSWKGSAGKWRFTIS